MRKPRHKHEERSSRENSFVISTGIIGVQGEMRSTGKKDVSVVEVFQTASAGSASCCERAATILQKTPSEMTELPGSLQLVCFVQPYIQTTEDNMGKAIKVLGEMRPCTQPGSFWESWGLSAALSLYSVWLDSEVGKQSHDESTRPHQQRFTKAEQNFNGAPRFC